MYKIYDILRFVRDYLMEENCFDLRWLNFKHYIMFKCVVKLIVYEIVIS